MKTKEEILKMQACISPFMPLNPIVSTLDAITAMQLYSDQQNKELREELQSLIKELDEVKTSHYQKLDAQLVEDVERLTEENKELREQIDKLANFIMNDVDGEPSQSEGAVDCAIRIIQRLTKEVEELKLKLSGKTFFNPFEQENTCLRELLAMYSGAVAANADFLKNLNAEIDNALNHKP